MIETLARGHGEAVRLSDLAGDLDIALSTAHAIVATLCERGWASRDPVDKTVSLGPALEITALHGDAARPRAHAARAAATQLGDELGFATSVTERTADALAVIYFGGRAELGDLLPSERIPLAAPFGSAFVAWDPATSQDAWIERGAITSADIAGRLRQSLEATRERGYSIERMTPVMTKAADLLQALDDDPWSEAVREIIDEALVDVATSGVDAGSEHGDRPVTAISAPVLDRHGRAVLNVAIHPFRPVAPRQVQSIGRRLIARTQGITNGRGVDGDR